MAGKRDSLRYAVGRANLTGSGKTVLNHRREAMRFADTLREQGFGVNKWCNVTNKHVGAVVDVWKSDGLSVATIKEYLSGVRAVAIAYGNDRIHPSNAEFGLERRVYVDNRDKAIPDTVYQTAVNRLGQGDENQQRLAAQITVMRELGLRHEEARKLNPDRALLRDGRIYIADGTKGGRDRVLHEPTARQIDAVRALRRFIGRHGNSMPDSMHERAWERYAYKQAARLGISRTACGASLHGLRHAYAQERYQQLAGFAPPCRFVDKKHFISNAFEKCGDDWRQGHIEAVALLTRELGHNRLEIISVYIGSYS